MEKEDNARPSFVVTGGGELTLLLPVASLDQSALFPSIRDGQDHLKNDLHQRSRSVGSKIKDQDQRSFLKE